MGELVVPPGPQGAQDGPTGAPAPEHPKGLNGPSGPLPDGGHSRLVTSISTVDGGLIASSNWCAVDHDSIPAGRHCYCGTQGTGETQQARDARVWKEGYQQGIMDSNSVPHRGMTYRNTPCPYEEK